MNNPGRLSRGCQLCQQGKWLCIFLTYRCNAGCHFCPAPFNDDRISSSLGYQKEEILSYLKKTDFEGISFSGGDPLLVFERLLEWLAFFKKHLPEYYYWVYTSGVSVTGRKMQQLSEGGMNEIRFNIAATGYLDENIWKIIKAARGIFPFVSVEIPSIERDFKSLVKALDKLESVGVDFLNLHEFILNNADIEFTNSQYSTFLLNEVIPLNYATSSIENTQKITDLVFKEGYSFAINNCSMQKKESQMFQRRLKMGKLFNNPEYDKVLPDGTICNFYSVAGNLPVSELQVKFASSDFRKEYSPYMLRLNDPKINDNPGGRIVSAIYIPQMGTDQGKIYLRTEVQ